MKCNWAETTGILLSEDPLPQELTDLQWEWEDHGAYSKLLGYFFGKGISREMVFSYLEDTMKKRLLQAKKDPNSFMTRVLIVNAILKGSCWYLLTLWTGMDEDLQRLEKITINFLWEGQKMSAYHRVDGFMLTLPKAEGG